MISNVNYLNDWLVCFSKIHNRWFLGSLFQKSLTRRHVTLRYHVSRKNGSIHYQAKLYLNSEIKSQFPFVSLRPRIHFPVFISPRLTVDIYLFRVKRSDLPFFYAHSFSLESLKSHTKSISTLFHLIFRLRSTEKERQRLRETIKWWEVSVPALIFPNYKVSAWSR